MQYVARDDQVPGDECCQGHQVLSALGMSDPSHDPSLHAHVGRHAEILATVTRRWLEQRFLADLVRTVTGAIREAVEGGHRHCLLLQEWSTSVGGRRGAGICAVHARARAGGPGGPPQRQSGSSGAAGGNARRAASGPCRILMPLSPSSMQSL